MKYLGTKKKPDKDCIICGTKIPANRLYCGKACGYMWRTYAKPQMLRAETH